MYHSPSPCIIQFKSTKAPTYTSVHLKSFGSWVVQRKVYLHSLTVHCEPNKSILSDVALQLFFGHETIKISHNTQEEVKTTFGDPNIVNHIIFCQNLQ